MLIRALCVCGLVLAFAASPAVSSNSELRPASTSTQIGHRHEGKLRLPRELRFMWRHEEHAHLKTMTKEQRHGWIRRQWAAMTPAQKERKIAELRAKWNGLPSNVRQTILEKKQQKRQARQMRRAEAGAGQSAGRNSQP